MNTPLRLRPPDETVDDQQWREARNEDVDELPVGQLSLELWRVGRIAARHPRDLVWRELYFVSVREWADERVALILERLAGRAFERSARPRKAVGPWIR